MDIVTRDEAREKGLKRYFTGAPCRHGHLADRYTSSTNCTVCVSISSQTAKKAYPERSAEREKSRDRTAYNKKRYASNKEKQIALVIKWRNENRDRHNATRRAYQKRKLANDHVFAMEMRVRNSINGSLSAMGFTKRSRSAAILGCTWGEFKLHIERQFLKGMTWENRNLWHIDHITPISTATTEEEVIALNHFTNLRPLWGVENIAKKDKIHFLI